MVRELGAQILEASRSTLYLKMRYLNLALGALQYQPREGNGYTGCDGQWIYYNTNHLVSLYEKTPILVNRLYYHMLLHCLFRHIWKREDRDHRLWNLACDITAESMVDDVMRPYMAMKIPAYRSMIYGEIRGQMKVITAEKVYTWLGKKKPVDMTLLRLESEFLVDDHTYWYQDEKSPHAQQMANSWKDIASRTQTSMETLSRGQDDSGGQMHSSLEYENRERYDYRAFLRRFAVYREEIGLDPDAFDTTFYTLGLQMYGNMPLIEPLEQKEIKRIQDFVIAIDTSLSCPEELVKVFLQETCQILQSTETFFRQIRIHVIQCDTQIQSVEIIRGKEDLDRYIEHLEIRGRGGTDFRPVFAHIEEMQNQGLFAHLKGLLYFTDGMGTFPRKPTAYETAFVFLDESGKQVEVPPWAMRLYINMEEHM